MHCNSYQEQGCRYILIDLGKDLYVIMKRERKRNEQNSTVLFGDPHRAMKTTWRLYTGICLFLKYGKVWGTRKWCTVVVSGG